LSLCFNWNHTVETCWGSVDLAPCILDLRTRWRWVVSFIPQLLYPQGKSPWYPLDRRLGGLQSSSGHGNEKNSQHLLGLKPPDYPAHSPLLYHWVILTLSMHYAKAKFWRTKIIALSERFVQGAKNECLKCCDCHALCLMLQNITMPHQWMEGNLPVYAKCAVCDKTCGSVLRWRHYYMAYWSLSMTDQKVLTIILEWGLRLVLVGH
jgi:hypothetical protein